MQIPTFITNHFGKITAGLAVTAGVGLTYHYRESIFGSKKKEAEAAEKAAQLEAAHLAAFEKLAAEKNKEIEMNKAEVQKLKRDLAEAESGLSAAQERAVKAEADLEDVRIRLQDAHANRDPAPTVVSEPKKSKGVQPTKKKAA